ncbi:uncharacterized protein LOC129716032 isoform X4 [Leucoraja erinacea]|uniref:uncharacterized protein LOC129716032 isoform X4 n=1 Tax=Leucoraja erinaceus TaxID=7782 RepID=UPI002454AEBF|nr:uncharacterized protein LOC129716032 isoform X4 [Leucoraja erinacea]
MREVVREMILFILLSFFHVQGALAGPHTLIYYYTLNHRSTHLEEYSFVGVLDGCEIQYYDNNMDIAVPRQKWMAAAFDRKYWVTDTFTETGFHGIIKGQVDEWMRRHNETAKYHYTQGQFGCQVNDHSPNVGILKLAFDGRYAFSFDKDKLKWTVHDPIAEPFKEKWDKNEKMNRYFKSLLEHDCVDYWRTYYAIGKTYLTRKEGNGKKDRHIGLIAVCVLISLAIGLAVIVWWRKNRRAGEFDVHTHAKNSLLMQIMGQPVIIQIENIYYPILAIIGVPANLMAIVILCRRNCGLSKCITRYLVYMATADLMVLIFEVVLYEIKDWPNSFLNYTPICSVNLALLFFSIDCSVWLTVAFTFDRLIAISCQSLRTKYCTEKMASMVIAIVCFVSVLENIPIFFIYDPREILDGQPWSCYVKSSFYTAPMWIAFLWLETILCPFAPFVLIMLLNSLTIRHIVRANRVRSALRGTNHTDTEIDNRRKSIILLLAISGNFILLWMVLFICYLFVHFTDTQFLEANYNDPFTIAEQSGYMLRCLSACTNTFIYAVSQGKFREELKHIVKRPLSIFIGLK